jgi:hypothetical protein
MDSATSSQPADESARSSRTPYREPASGVSTPILRSRGFDADLGPVAVVLWAVSVVRVALACLRHEIFGAEATIAVLLVVGLSRLLAPTFGRR